MRSPLSLSSRKLRKGKEPMLISLSKSSSCLFICLLQMLNYQASDKSSLTFCHWVSKFTWEKDKESFLTKRRPCVLRMVATCLFMETSIVTLKLTRFFELQLPQEVKLSLLIQMKIHVEVSKKVISSYRKDSYSNTSV